MKSKQLYREKFPRLVRAKELALTAALLLKQPDPGGRRRMVALVGDYIGDCIRVEGLFERQALAILRDHVLNCEKTKGQVALDVGANIGNHTLFFSDLFSRVIAFEPNPMVRAILQMNIELNRVENVEVRPLGLSDAPGSATLVFENSNLGGATLHASMREGTQAQERAEIELAVGDQVIDRDEPVGLIKIDVEGAEEAVLRGLEQTIRAHRPVIMIEQWPDVIDESTGASPSLLFLQGLGYSAWEADIARAFRGRLGKLRSLVLGRLDYVLQPVTRLEKREYPALIFMPPESVSAQPQS